LVVSVIEEAKINQVGGSFSEDKINSNEEAL